MLSEANISAVKANLVALGSILQAEPTCKESSSQQPNTQSVVGD